MKIKYFTLNIALMVLALAGACRNPFWPEKPELENNSDKIVSSITVKEQPATLNYTHSDLLNLAGLEVTLIYNDTTTENVAIDDFNNYDITTIPANGASLIHSVHNNNPVLIKYGELSANTMAIIVNPLPITDVVITVIAPAKNDIPNTTAIGGGNFSIINVAWTPDDSPFLGNTVYTVTAILNAYENHLFHEHLAAQINGEDANISNNTGTAVTLSYAFSETLNKVVDYISIKEQPDNLVYTHGDSLDLSGLEVTLSFDDTTTENVLFAHFRTKNISDNPPNGTELIRSMHNNHPVVVSYGALTANTNDLTVNKAPGNFGTHAAINTIYTPSLTLASLNSHLLSGYAWNAPSTSLSAGNGQSFTATYTDSSGNYEAATGTITVNVAKAIGATVTVPALNTKTHNSITVNPVAASTGQTVEYASNVANAAPSTGWQTDTTLSGLNAGTTYYIFARSAGNSNYETGAASGSLAVTTLQTIAANTVEYYWVDEHDVITTTSSGNGNTITLPRGETLTITANGSGYSNQRWYINGTEDKLQAGNVTYFFSSEGKDARQYTVTLIVEKDGKYYNANFAVTVTE